MHVCMCVLLCVYVCMCLCVCVLGLNGCHILHSCLFLLNQLTDYPNNVCLKPNLLLAGNVIFFRDRLILEAIMLKMRLLG